MVGNTQTTSQVCGICGKGGYLFKCGRCKTTYYCSKLCQTQNWTVHKTVCKSRSALLSLPEFIPPQGFDTATAYMPAVLIYLEPGDSIFSYAGAFLGPLSPTDPEFVDLPVTRRIGFALGMFSAKHVGLQVPNDKAASLTFDIDTTSAQFGQTTTVPTGAVVVARRDGRHIKVGHVMAVCEYLRREVGQAFEMVQDREEEGETVDREAVLEQYLTPMAFRNGVERMKQKFKEAGNRGWEEVECPELDGELSE
ncbi:Egl nine 1 [Elasticomyces elasticus]|nr:Egl nine 1 [Elasticomyces elasticus]KAK3640276.1 Egl nine 1 [Elasticomyces elasticus]KAK4920553.1 Egl nine 1 [Elasticomyces elasticus]KAK5758947.1 Egl nine 1 [Elasticomyces elasticus]